MNDPTDDEVDAVLDVYTARGEDPAIDGVGALKMAMIDMGTSMEAVVGLVAHWGIGNLPVFQRAWLQLILGDPGSNERAVRGGVRLFFGHVNTDDQVDVEDVDPDTVWAGRLASAWIAGDTDTVAALEACEATESQQRINRAVELLRGISWLIVREAPEDARSADG